MSATFAKNDLVMYELYNEPHIDSYATWSAGDETYAGMLEMYEVVRNNVSGILEEPCTITRISDSRLGGCPEV